MEFNFLQKNVSLPQANGRETRVNKTQKNKDVHHHGKVSRISKTLINESLYKYEHNDVNKTNIIKTRIICLNDGPLKYDE
jgi:hypothetical protein